MEDNSYEGRVLIAEDEKKVAASVKRGLEENGFYVDVAYDGTIALRMAEENKYDVMILDLNLPGMNGYEICKSVRCKNNVVSIIMLTALGGLDSKLDGFDAGADDYMVKPFEFRELLARVKALIKRKSQTPNTGNILKVGDLEMDIYAKSVKRAGKKIELTAKEFMLLEYLVRNKGRVISRGEIGEKIWDVTFDTGTNVIDVYVNFIRKKIDREHPVKLIHTHVGMGYTIRDNSE
jgi:DNA-binding response OmpR family regulator